MTRALLKFINTPALILMTIIGLAIQSSLFAPWPLYLIQPDVVLLTVIWVGLRRHFTEGGVVTLLLANIAEIHSSTPQGIFLSSYMVIYFFIRLAAHFFVIPSFFSYAMFVFLSSLLWKFTHLLFLYLLGAGAHQWKHTLTFLLLDAALNAGYSLLVFQALEKFDWITFKNARAQYAVDEALVLESEGF